MSTAIKLTIPDKLAKRSKENIQHIGYTNLQELVLEGLRKINQEIEDQKNVAFLKSLQGKSKGKFLTKSNREKLGDEFLKEKDKLKIFREFNLN